MDNIIIDEEFKALLPELDTETFAGLEENVLQHGVRDPIVLWNSILIDGHNRYAICQKHDLPFHTINMKFSSREEVLIWIIGNQITRRNLSQMQLSHFRGLHYRADKKIQGSNNQYIQKGENPQNEVFHREKSTSSRLAARYNVSRATIERDAKLSEAIDEIGLTSPEAKRKILSGEVSINKNVLQDHASKSKEEVSKIAAQIEEGSYEKKMPEPNVMMTPFEEAITKITGELFSELKRKARAGDAKELKSTLRSYITLLEELYGVL